MISRRPVFVVAAAATFFGWMLSGAAYGADAPPQVADAKVGIVDVSRVEDEYVEVKNAVSQVDTMKNSLASILKMRQKYSLLPAQELDELEKLTGMEKPEEKDNARVQEITKKGDDLAAELEALRNKKEPTDQDKARLNELTDLSRKATSDVEARRAQYDTDLQNKAKDLFDKANEKMNAAIAELARQKGLWTVLAKPFVLWGGADLTNDLIEKLNKDAKKQ
ncbi:MAG: OmpH family outer membrane protein [Armatimonadota bacterium]|nr:OmpH family outer membrane protein [Armatimonadota bacterium]